MLNFEIGLSFAYVIEGFINHEEKKKEEKGERDRERHTHERDS